MGFVKEFKDFAIKGNMLDMAIGIIIGSAFSKVVNSLVAEVIMPPLGLLIGKVDFKDFRWVLQEGKVDAAGVELVKQVSLNYGMFIQVMLDFVIVAFAVFLMVRTINRFKRKEEAKPVAPSAPPADIQLLTEIRDLLKK